MSRSSHDNTKWPGMAYIGTPEEVANNLFMDGLIRKMEEAAALGIPFPQIYFPEVLVTFPGKIK